MSQVLLDLGRTGGIGAASYSLSFRLYHVTATDRAAARHDEHLLFTSAPRDHRANNLWNDLTSTLHHHYIANTNILSSDILFVMQCRLLNGNPTD